MHPEGFVDGGIDTLNWEGISIKTAHEGDRVPYIGVVLACSEGASGLEWVETRS
jgi:hypothetical protein